MMLMRIFVFFIFIYTSLYMQTKQKPFPSQKKHFLHVAHTLPLNMCMPSVYITHSQSSG